MDLLLAVDTCALNIRTNVCPREAPGFCGCRRIRADLWAGINFIVSLACYRKRRFETEKRYCRDNICISGINGDIARS